MTHPMTQSPPTGELVARDEATAPRHQISVLIGLPAGARQSDRFDAAAQFGTERARAIRAERALTASQEEVERLKALVTDMTKAARTLELAETELCRAEATAEQPRLMNAGTRYYAAKQMVFSVAFRARAAIQLEESKP